MLFGRLAAAWTILVGVLVTLGWILDISFFRSILPNLSTMKINTALAFILSGTSLWLFLAKQVRYRRFLAQICGFTVLVVGALTSAEYILGLDLGIDQFVLRDPSAPSGMY